MYDELQVRKDIVQSLKEWGVDPSFNSQHKQFHDKVVRCAESYFHGQLRNGNENDDEIAADDDEPFPCSSNMMTAVAHVLECDIVDRRSSATVVSDSLGSGFEPYYVGRDGRARKRKGFEGYDRLSLDPFARFSYEEVDAAEDVFRSWFELPNDSLYGVAFEAVVAWHVARDRVPCRACSGSGALRWAGGFSASSSWRDMVCVSCDASYEIKSKASLEKVERSFEFNRILGGSFRTFCAAKRSRPGINQRGRMFVVVVCRTFTVRNDGSRVWPTSVAEIRHATPRLTAESFVPDESNRMSMGSRIVVGPKSSWVAIPSTQCDFVGLAKDIFIKQFSLDVWNDLCERQKSGWKKEAERTTSLAEDDEDLEEARERERKNGEEQKSKDIAAIRLSLDDLRVDDKDDENDWEQCYSD